MAGRSSHEMDITHGSIFPKYVSFIIPMMLTYLLQYAFNSADMIVIGQFEGADSLAAVGSTTVLVNLIVNFFAGLSNGVNITVATDYAGEKFDDVSKEVHTAMATGLLGGVIFGVIGILSSRPLLTLMQSPDNVIDLSVAYLFAYYIGMPVGIPACLTGYHLALHGLISRNKVLDTPCEHMAYVRLAVCRRRPVIKYIARIALMFFDGFFKNIVVLPEFLDLLFSFHEIHGGVNLSV